MPASHWSRRSFNSILGLGAALASGLIRPEQAAAQINRSGAGGLAPPSNGSFLVPIIRKLALDKKNGLDFDINLYSDPSTLYSDFAAARTSHIFGAIYNCANFYVRGLPLKLLFTISTANHAFVSKDPAVKNAKDLEGKTVAATTSSGFYGMAVLFLKENGLDPRKNLNVINAPPVAVQTELLADKADAGLLFDPALSSMLTKGYHLIGDMNDGIRDHLKMKHDAPVWYLGAYAHRDWVEADPNRAAATMKMWQEAAQFYNQSPDDADKLISEFTHVSREALKLSRSLGITKFDVQPAITQKANLDALFRGFHEVGFLNDLPDDGIYHKWAS
ncbi:MAG TPA: ABC transporter substrate-binding protein [Nitrobacter sp.]|nr:ABC transporter substrate-binding protein [Nitrobacter sp.]